MEEFSVILAAIAPGVALLSYFYLKNKYETEPILMVFRAFLFGVLLVFPTMIIQRAFVLAFGENEWLFAFGISSGIEEFVKWFILFYILYKHTVFNEPYDGILYAVSVSLGYATLENVIYVLLYPISFSELIMRALLPVSAHALFGVVMGYYLGKAKFENKVEENKYIVYSLLVPVLWHGIFDLILLKFETNWIYIITPLMVFYWFRGMGKVNRANDKSPFRVVLREDQIKISSNGS